MNFNKKFKGQVQHSATQNVNANPLTGITTSFDGIMVGTMFQEIIIMHYLQQCQH